MKILHIAFLMGIGGLECHLMDLLKYYPDATTEHVVVFCGKRLNPKLRSRVTFMEKEGRLTFRKLNNSTFEQIVHEERPDVMHIPEHKCLLDAYLVFLKTGIPLIHVSHAPPDYQLPLLEPYHYKLMKFMALSDITHYAVSNYTAHFYKNLFNYPKFEPLWNGKDLSHFSFSSVNRKKIRAKHTLPENALVIGNVGRINFNWKRQDWIIDAIEYLHLKGIDNVYGFILGGDDGSFLHLHNKVEQSSAKNYLRIAGFQSDTAPYYSAFDILAHSSRMEACPLVLIEAASCNLPIIACTPYDPNGTEEDGYGIIRNGYNGLIVNANNKQAFFDNLEELVRNKVLRDSFASIARQSIEKFSIEEMCKRYHKIFTEATQKPKSIQHERLNEFKTTLLP